VFFLSKKHVFLVLKVWFVLKRCCIFEKKPSHLQAKYLVKNVF
jgi:hypothetical protein